MVGHQIQWLISGFMRKIIISCLAISEILAEKNFRDVNLKSKGFTFLRLIKFETSLFFLSTYLVKFKQMSGFFGMLYLNNS
jgi:hypothetical protein